MGGDVWRAGVCGGGRLPRAASTSGAHRLAAEVAVLCDVAPPSGTEIGELNAVSWRLPACEWLARRKTAYRAECAGLLCGGYRIARRFPALGGASTTT